MNFRAETVQIPETDTSPVKTKMVLQSVHPGTNTNETTSPSMERVPEEVVNLEGSIGSSGDWDKNVYCEENLRSLSEDEIKTLMEVTEESIAKILEGPIVSERVVDELMLLEIWEKEIKCL